GGDPNSKPKTETPPVSLGSFASASDISNLLPNDTQMVVNVVVPEFLKSPLARTAFETPGAFDGKFIEQRFGLVKEELERVILAASATQDWLFFVVRTNKPIKMDNVKRVWQLKPGGGSPMAGQDYYVTARNWLPNGSFLTSTTARLKGPVAPGARPLWVRLH